jgi:hypothetical protein
MTGATLAGSQGLYYLASGVWPIVHLPSFEAVTGPKREGWLVKTTGALIAAVGATLLTAGRRRQVTPEIELLGLVSAAALGAVGIWYGGARRRISRVYVIDGVTELALAATWLLVRRAGRPDNV